MELCSICGSHKHVCSSCGAELHKRFDEFVVRAEIIYAIFMAWGFASSAEAVIRAKDWAGFPLLVIASFVLIRFFFAPTRNLHTAALLSEGHKKTRWLVFVLDFPLLLFHSFAFYTLCVATASGAENAYRFFQWFVILLSANVVWLVSIALRMRLWGKHRHFWTFVKWSINNSLCILLFFAAFSCFLGGPASFGQLFFTKDLPLVVAPATLIYRIFFSLALLNCLGDVILTASDYLGFDHS